MFVSIYTTVWNKRNQVITSITANNQLNVYRNDSNRPIISYVLKILLH